MTPMLCAGILQAAILATGADATANQALPPSGAPRQAVAKPESYKEAHRVTTATGKPMVVMVSTDWCVPCQMMKKKILPRVRAGGLLRKVAFAMVNADRERELAEKLTDGGPVPQLVMFRKTSHGWLRRRLVGAQSVETVEQFINEGLVQDAGDKKPHSGAKDHHS